MHLMIEAGSPLLNANSRTDRHYLNGRVVMLGNEMNAYELKTIDIR